MSPTAGYYRAALEQGDLTVEEALQDALTDAARLAQMRKEVRKFLPQSEVYVQHRGAESAVIIEARDGEKWEIPVGATRRYEPPPPPAWARHYQRNSRQFWVRILIKGRRQWQEFGPYDTAEDAEWYAGEVSELGDRVEIVERGHERNPGRPYRGLGCVEEEDER